MTTGVLLSEEAWADTGHRFQRTMTDPWRSGLGTVPTEMAPDSLQTQGHSAGNPGWNVWVGKSRLAWLLQLHARAICTIDRYGAVGNMASQAQGTVKMRRRCSSPACSGFRSRVQQKQESAPCLRVEASAKQRNPPSTIRVPGTRKVPIRVDRTYLWVTPSQPQLSGVCLRVSATLTQPPSVSLRTSSENESSSQQTFSR